MRRSLEFGQQLAQGQEIGGYRIRRLIGRGGMAEVYEAEDMALGRQVAFKVPLADARGKHQNERFLNEARKAALIHHQNVITIYAAGQSDGLLYLVMQFVDGKDLSELMRSYGSAIPWYQALKIIRLAARGLHAVHQQGLVHRDIKPSNIMLSSSLKVFVMDFGLVRDEDSNLTATGDVLGTPPFMSPEQCRGEKIDHRSDVYSLGATLYSMLSGRPPFDGSTLQIVRRVGKGTRPTPIQSWVPKVPEDVAALIQKAMAVRPGNRFPDALEMSKAAGRLLKQYKPDDTENWDTVSVPSTQAEQDTQVSTPIVELVPLVPNLVSDSLPDQRKQWLMGSTVLLLAVLGLGAIAFVQSGGDRAAPPPVIPATVEHEDMVLVTAGPVRLGNEESKVRRFFEQVGFDSRNIDNMWAVCAESPTQSVDVNEFWIDQYEVTNADYARFVKETRHQPPSHWVGGAIPLGAEDHPVVNVTYNDAQAYADWCGKQLPTREQWTRAFRGGTDHLFPWGDTYELTWINVNETPRVGAKTTTPVQATPRDVSPFQVYNLAGNASEFVRGTFFQDNNAYRMVKGGSFEGLGSVYGLAPMFTRYGMDVFRKDTGFRCVIEKN